MAGTEIDSVHGVAAATPSGVAVHAVGGVAAAAPGGLHTNAVYGVAAAFTLAGVAGTLTVSVHGVAAAWVAPVEPVQDPQGPNKAPTDEALGSISFTVSELEEMERGRIRGVWNIPTQSQVVEIDGTEYRIRIRWAARRQRFLLDLYSAAGSPLLVGRVLSSGVNPLSRSGPGIPDVVAIVHGPDDYSQADLGESLGVKLYPRRALKSRRSLVSSQTTVLLHG